MWQQLVEDLHDYADMTFEQIGDRIGLARNSVHDLFTGKTETPRPDVRRKLQRLHNLKFPTNGRGVI